MRRPKDLWKFSVDGLLLRSMSGGIEEEDTAARICRTSAEFASFRALPHFGA